ncbi:MAG TPA: VanW family protein [Coriobacteriia bacterium]|nr:VanW family protein [Coriobacteriia bacterium]
MTEPENAYQPTDYAGRRAERARQRSGSTHRRLILIATAAIVALLVVGGTAEAVTTSGRIHPGVSVAGVRVGGLKPANARSALRTSLPTRASEPITVKYGERSWEVQGADVGLTFDYNEQVALAMAVGRGDDLVGSIGERLNAWLGGVELVATPKFNDAKLEIVLRRIAKGTDKRAKNATVKIEGTTPVVVDGKNGRALDREKTSRLMSEAFMAPAPRVVSAPVPVAQMKITAAAAKRAADTAEVMLDAPVTVTYKDKSWEFGPEDVAKWIRFRAAETTGSGEGELEAYISPKAAQQPIALALGTKVGRPARDARFKTSNGSVTILPSREGIGPDVRALTKSLTAVLSKTDGERTVRLRTQRTKPEVTTEQARKMGIKERISTYTTTYGADNLPRVNNIHRLGEALDGTLIEPGGVFSFNGAAGERTAAKGYQEAAAIVNGKLVPQLGGGVCQVGTTIFNSVFESGLPVVERRNHSFYISHYPTGRDATVSWGGPDFKFKNDTEHWILVSVSYTSSSLTISLYGTDPDYDIEADVGEWTNKKDFEVEEIKDPDLPKGTQVIEDTGVTGRSIVVKRIVSKDGKVVRTDSFVSNYRPKSQVVRVGTKKSDEKSDSKTP